MRYFMNKKIRKLIFLGLFFCTNINMFAQVGIVTTAPGSIMLDPSNWITAIDELYASYDMVKNTITQIENQYAQIQQAIERAKSIDWDNIRFDGDFDIRNDLKDANRRVNKLLTQTRTVKDSLTQSVINVGGVQYSLADLCGAGSDGKNIFTAFNDTKKYMTESMQRAVKALEEELPQEQKIAIWKKYGISPRNYIFVQQSAAFLKNKAQNAIAAVTEKALETKFQEVTDTTNTIINTAYHTLDSNGNPTATALAEVSNLLTQQAIFELQKLGTSIGQTAELIALDAIVQDADKEAKAEEQKEQDLMDTRRSQVVSPRFFLDE